MRILNVAMKYDYGKPEQGYSFEHCNFYDSLSHMGHDIVYFDFMTLLQQHGRERMNERLLQVVRAETPDLLFCVLHTDELDQSVIREVSENTDTLTLNWFCDDHWRFDDFSRHWAPCFNWVVTTATSALQGYKKIGYRNVIKSQWACNQFLYQRQGLPLTYDVAFVGQPHGNRRSVIQALRDSGIDVHAWGSGWESGRLSQDEMMRVFSGSRINLNLSNASAPLRTSLERARDKAVNRVSSALHRVPLGRQLRTLGRSGISTATTAGSTINRIAGRETQDQRYSDQIKGRNFEVPGCGGFLLTSSAENLEDYYVTGREIVCFEDTSDLIGKVRYYLEHDEERARIAEAGYNRTLGEHTYVHRFCGIFQNLGLPAKPAGDILGEQVHRGKTEEIQ